MVSRHIVIHMSWFEVQGRYQVYWPASLALNDAHRVMIKVNSKLKIRDSVAISPLATNITTDCLLTTRDILIVAR